MLAVAEFRRAGLYDVHIGPGTRLRVAVKQPEATHELQFGKLEESLTGARQEPERAGYEGAAAEGAGRREGVVRVVTQWGPRRSSSPDAWKSLWETRAVRRVSDGL